MGRRMGTTTGEQDRFPRWQGIAIEHLRYAINLYLGLSVATLGFEVSLLLNPSFEPGSCLQRVSLFVSMIALALSIAVGSSAVFTRLNDFRLTMQLARGNAGPEVRTEANRWSSATWYLFYLQLGSFCVGILLAVMRFGSLAADKLL